MLYNSVPNDSNFYKIQNQKYVRITIYYNGHMGRNKALCGKSIAIKIPDSLTGEDNSDNLHDMCFNYLHITIPNNTIETSLEWRDIIEWEFSIIEEKDLNDNAYDVELINTDYFYIDSKNKDEVII